MTTEVQIIDRGSLVKLFGATIRVAQSHLPPSSAAAGGPTSPPAYRTEHSQEASQELHHNDKKAKTDDDSPRSMEHLSPLTKSKEQSNCSADDRESEAAEEEEMDDEARGEMTYENTKNKQEDDKASLAKKKPDKLLPCPRCDSMDTKFCYFNNYNVNQPRHFCRQCQRYWTAGGAVRPNMPVGAGRRKKSSRAGGGARCLQQDGGVVMVLDSVADHAAATATGDGDGSILSFGGGGSIVSPSSNCATSNQRQVSAMQASPVENFQVPPPQVPWPVNGVGNHPMYFYGGNPTMPAANSVCGVNSNGFNPTPQPVHLCWTPTAGAPGGWQLFSVVPWAQHMPSYHPAAAPPPMVSAPTAIGKQSYSHDVDRHSFGSSVVEDRQSSSSLEASPRSKPATAKKRSSAIREEEEAGACRSYQLMSDRSNHRTEEVSKVLHSNPAAMMRSLNFQEGV